MGRTISITDDDKGMSASLRVETREGVDIVTALHFDALDGHGITAEDSTRLAEALGLPLAVPSTISQLAGAITVDTGNGNGNGNGNGRAAIPAAEPPAATPTKAVSGPARQPARAGTRQRGRASAAPSDAALASMYHQNGGNISRMARAMGGVPATTQTWVRNARKRSPHLFAAEQADVTVAGS